MLLVGLAALSGGGIGWLMTADVGQRAFAEPSPQEIVAAAEQELREKGFWEVNCKYKGKRSGFEPVLPSYHVAECIADGNKETVFFFNKDHIKSSDPLFFNEREA